MRKTFYIVKNLDGSVFIHVKIPHKEGDKWVSEDRSLQINGLYEDHIEWWYNNVAPKWEDETPSKIFITAAIRNREVNYDWNESRFHMKYFIIDCHAASGNICFIRDNNLKLNGDDDPNEHYHTYNIDWALVFDTKKEAEDYIKKENLGLCPSVVDYRVAEGIAIELFNSHRSWNDEFIC